MTIPVGGYAKAVQAYNQAAKGNEGVEAEEAPQHGSFASMVKEAIGDVVSQAKQGEMQSTSALSNNGDLSQVVTAVAEAEVALQTIVAVRNRVVQAYQEIMRMPI